MRITARGAAIVFGFAVLLPASQAAAPNLIERVRLVLDFEVLSPGTRGPARQRLELAGGGERQAALEVRWPSGPEGRLVLRAETVEAGPGLAAASIVGELRLSDGRLVRASRRLEFETTTTAFFEVAREDGTPLLLAIRAEALREAALAPPPSVGAPVEFTLEVQRVERGQTISLETNQLRTLVGQSVSYSFRLGKEGGSDVLLLQLTPTRLAEQIAEVELEISGTLPAGERTIAVGRKEQFLSSAGATSAFAVESGEPPSGYRFLVSCRF
ncbi:MAG TPA: hypothetical protein VJS92_13680 [Candidatus Polarisedimenticolaceae bacterium]|nr:hypothetical protein [Candidatus Polarisedimenticolaceae bacterium]